MKTKIFAQIALVIGALYGISEQGTALATLPESPVGELSQDTLNVALERVKEAWENRLKTPLYLAEEKLAALRQFDTRNLNLDILKDESDELLKVPEDVRKYFKCLTVDLDDDYKLYLIVKKGSWHCSTASADGKLLYGDHFLTDGELGI